MGEKGLPMNCGVIRLSVLGVALTSIAGCGGSSGGGSGTGGTGGGNNNSTTVTYTINGGTPTAVATQIGSGSFTAATLNGGKLTLSLPSGTTNFAVAYVCPPLPSTEILETDEDVFEASSLDGVSFSGGCPSPVTGSATGNLTGTIDSSAISGASSLYIYVQNGSALGGGTGGVPISNFQLEAPTGTDRVELAVYSSDPNLYPQSYSLLAAKKFSNQAVPGQLNGGNTVVLGAADETTLEPITYNNVPAGYSAPATSALFQMDGNNTLGITSPANSAYPALPAGAVESGDHYLLYSTARSTLEPTEAVYAETNLTSAGPVSFTFPAAWSYAGPAAARWPSYDLSYTGFSGNKAGACNIVSMEWWAGSNVASVELISYVQVNASANYLNGSTTVAVPDLSGLSGFVAPPASGTSVSWGAVIYHGDYYCL